MMELVDVVDSKSTAGDSVPVRVRPPAYQNRLLLSGQSVLMSIAKAFAATGRASGCPSIVNHRPSLTGDFIGVNRWPFSFLPQAGPKYISQTVHL